MIVKFSYVTNWISIMSANNTNLLIRKSAFETNSSSCHVLTIGKSNKNRDELYLRQEDDGHLYIATYLDDYHWGYELLDDVTSRLSYILSSLTDFDNSYNRNYFYRLIRELKDYLYEQKIENVNGLLVDGIKVTWEDFNNFGYELKEIDIDKFIAHIGNQGSIDHESCGAFAAAFNSDDSVINFLFNSGSSVLVYNDNTDDLDERIKEVEAIAESE